MSWKRIEDLYAYRCQHGNVKEHLPILRDYAQKVNHITEFGFGGGWSGSAFMMARPKRYISYDINVDRKMANLFGSVGLNFTVIQADTSKIEIEPTELLFIDSLHTYTHLKKELELHADKVRKWIIMHDTQTYGRTGQDKQSPGLMDAIEEFIDSNPNWVIKEIRTNCHGLTILERV